MNKHNWIFLLTTLTFATLIGCTKDDENNNEQQAITFGNAVALGDDSIRSYIVTDVSGQPTEMGLQLGESALNNLPTDTSGGIREFSYPIPLPANIAGMGVDHIEVDWNPYGHDPVGIYTVPHFDFHFYYVDEATQGSVTPGIDTAAVDPQYVPQDYVSGVVAVPNMGVHFIDTTSAEFHGLPFTSTFIYGFYHGNFMFLEPMVTKAFFESHPDFTAPVKQPQAFQIAGYYPASYAVKYDAENHVYRIALTELTKH